MDVETLEIRFKHSLEGRGKPEHRNVAIPKVKERQSSRKL